jgi:hypothetical protein
VESATEIVIHFTMKLMYLFCYRSPLRAAKNLTATAAAAVATAAIPMRASPSPRARKNARARKKARNARNELDSVKA